MDHTLREKCPHSEFFWSVFSRIQTEDGDIRSASPYSIWMQENTYQKATNMDTFPTLIATKLEQYNM